MRGINKHINPRVSGLTRYINNGGHELEKFTKALKKHIRGVEFGVKNGNAS
jgi:hypothetical protein